MIHIFFNSQEVAMTFDINAEPLMAGNSWINIARLIHQQCVRPEFRNYTIPLPVLGNQVCQSDIAGKFLSFLQQKLQVDINLDFFIDFTNILV